MLPGEPVLGADAFAFLRSELPANRRSPNWLGYSCYDVILLTEEEAEGMPAPIQMAIRRYLECGGKLLVHGRNVPAVFTQGGLSDGEGGYFVGFGHAATSFDDDKADWDSTRRKLAGTPLHDRQPPRTPGNLYDLLVAEATVPVRGLFVLVLLFGVAIGPVNVWLLSIYKRRIWLWWNVPVISLLSCLAVFCYALASEGWTGRGKIASLTFLDERCHRATTIGYLSYYCPLTPSGGLRFGTDTEVTRLENEAAWERSHYYGQTDTELRFVDWTGDQHLTSGWVTARVPAYFQIRKNEDRREPLGQPVSYELLRGSQVIARGSQTVPSGTSRLIFRDTAAQRGCGEYLLRVHGQGRIRFQRTTVPGCWSVFAGRDRSCV